MALTTCPGSNLYLIDKVQGCTSAHVANMANKLTSQLSAGTQSLKFNICSEQYFNELLPIVVEQP